MAGTLVNIGNAQWSLGSYGKALEYYQRGLELAEAIGHRQWAANALGNIGLIYARLGSHAKALKYKQRALKLMEELGDRAGVAWELGNIGVIHHAWRAGSTKALQGRGTICSRPPTTGRPS